MPALGKIQRIYDLRTIWPHEAHDFSKWMAQPENLEMLSETIGIDISFEETESPVGDFSVDLYAVEETTGRKIIIENQLEETNHDHLGKIITYASGKEAEIIIWIVKRARDEHKKAIEWLNQHTDENIGFFLLEIELWKIGDSLPAPKFNIIECPNDWAKIMKTPKGLSSTQALQLEFWQAFNDYVYTQPHFIKTFSTRKPRPRNCYDLSVGSSFYHIVLTVNTGKKLIGAEIYIDNNKRIFENFQSVQADIEKAMGIPLIWTTAAQDCRIRAFYSGDIKANKDSWNEYFDWLCTTSLKFHSVIKKYKF